MKGEISGGGFARWELPAVLLLAWLVFISVPISRGNLGLSWDALNHHIYLGWIAEHARFDLDRLAGSYQTYQYPYLYWPVYKLAAAGLSGLQAGVVLATLHLVAVPPVWMIARACIPGPGLFESFMRVLAVALAFMTAVVLKLLEATSNDLLAAAPFVWAMAFSLEAYRNSITPARAGRLIVWAGFMAGVSVAFKLSNGPLALLLPLLWAMADGDVRQRGMRVITGGLACCAGFLLAYGWWGWELWSHFGNPIYPFSDNLFEPIRSHLGWQP